MAHPLFLEDFTLFPANWTDSFKKYIGECFTFNVKSAFSVSVNKVDARVNGWIHDIANEFYFQFKPHTVISLYQTDCILLPVSVFVDCNMKRCKELIDDFIQNNPSFKEIPGYNSLRATTNSEKRMMIDYYLKPESCFVMGFSTCKFGYFEELVQFSTQIYNFLDSSGIEPVIFCKGETLISSQKNNSSKWNERIKEYLSATEKL